MLKNYLWGIFPYSYIPIHGRSNICYLYAWWNIFCSIQRPFVIPLLLFSHVRPRPHFVMSNYHQSLPLATEIWGQHHNGLKSIMWDTLTRHLWCVEWCSRHVSWKAVWRGSGIQKKPLKRESPSHSPGTEATLRAYDGFHRSPLAFSFCQETTNDVGRCSLSGKPWFRSWCFVWRITLELMFFHNVNPPKNLGNWQCDTEVTLLPPIFNTLLKGSHLGGADLWLWEQSFCDNREQKQGATSHWWTSFSKRNYLLDAKTQLV